LWFGAFYHLDWRFQNDNPFLLSNQEAIIYFFHRSSVEKWRISFLETNLQTAHGCKKDELILHNAKGSIVSGNEIITVHLFEAMQYSSLYPIPMGTKLSTSNFASKSAAWSNQVSGIT
jgi:hypothetical protein